MSLSLLLLITSLYASDVESVNRQIASISGREQSELAQLIVEKSRKHGVNPALVVAIAAKESSLGIQKINHKSKDYGILQVNIYNIDAYGWDLERIINDDAYGLEKGIIILKYFKKKYKHKEPDTWICRYNIGHQSLNNPKIYKKCMEYTERVRSYLLLD